MQGSPEDFHSPVAEKWTGVRTQYSTSYVTQGESLHCSETLQEMENKLVVPEAEGKGGQKVQTSNYKVPRMVATV